VRGSAGHGGGAGVGGVGGGGDGGDGGAGGGRLPPEMECGEVVGWQSEVLR